MASKRKPKKLGKRPLDVETARFYKLGLDVKREERAGGIVAIYLPGATHPTLYDAAGEPITTPLAPPGPMETSDELTLGPLGLPVGR